MKSYWLNKNNNKNLIVFFAGWSFDETPFKSIPTDNNDVIIIYDYNDLTIIEDLKDFSQYEHKTLVAWSMGVFVANKLKNMFENFDYKLAINGTPTPVDNNFGIPVKMFELTLKHAQKGLEGKFYKNVFNNDIDFEKYEKAPVTRTVENRVQELQNLYEMIKCTNSGYEKFYDFAIICEDDKIIPPTNQIASHKKNNIPFKLLPFVHFPYYNFTSWNEIIKCQ